GGVPAVRRGGEGGAAAEGGGGGDVALALLELRDIPVPALPAARDAGSDIDPALLAALVCACHEVDRATHALGLPAAQRLAVCLAVARAVEQTGGVVRFVGDAYPRLHAACCDGDSQGVLEWVDELMQGK
ncbi:hypothetical protein MNEG_15660, partial [Monoraphidium neglectum]